MLLEWAVRYVEFRASAGGSPIVEIKGNKIICRDRIYYIIDELDGSVFEFSFDEKITLVCLNKKPNINFTVEHWAKLIQYPNLLMIFVNPAVNGKWVLSPRTHSLIADEHSLKRGLISLSNTVEEIA